jgi:hypothetical protein
MNRSATNDGRSGKRCLRQSMQRISMGSPKGPLLARLALRAARFAVCLRLKSFPNVRQDNGGPSWIAFGNIWKHAGQRAATTPPNSAESCVNAAIAVGEAG